MRWHTLFCLIVFSICSVGHGEEATSCLDIFDTFEGSPVITSEGHYFSKKSNSGAIRLESEDELLALSNRDATPHLTILKSKYDSSKFRLYRASVARPSVNHPITKQPISGQLYLLIHPELSLIVVDETGVIIRLAPELAILKGKDVKKVFIVPTSRQNENTIVIITDDNIAYSISLTVASDTRPITQVRRQLVYQITGDLNKIENYRFVELSNFNLTNIQYIPGEVAREREVPLPKNLNGINKDSLTPINFEGRKVFLFSYDRGFAYWDPQTNQIVAKPYAVDRSISLKLSFHSIFDLEKRGLIAVITESGDLKLIDRANILDPEKQTFQFINSVLGHPETGALFHFGKLLYSKVLPPGNIIKIKVARLMPGTERASAETLSRFAMEYVVDTYILTLMSDGNFEIDLKASETIQPER